MGGGGGIRHFIAKIKNIKRFCKSKRPREKKSLLLLSFFFFSFN